MGNRNSSIAQETKGAILVCAGRCAEGRDLLLGALRLDPRGHRRKNMLAMIATSYYFAGAYGDAADAARRAVAEFPAFAPSRRTLAAALGQLGRHKEAAESLREAIAVAPSSFDLFTRSWHSLYRPEDQDHVLDGLRKAGWQG